MSLSVFIDPLPTSLEGTVPQQLAAVADRIVRAQDLHAAHELRFLIDSLLNAKGAQQPSGNLVPTVALLDLLLFDALSQQQALTWLREHFVAFLSDERIDVFQQIRLRLLVIEYDNRDAEKEAMRRALASSEQLIGQGQLVIDGQSLSPTVANWITAYRRSSQVPKRTNIERSQFLFDDATAKALEETDRHLVADTLYMYDLLGLATRENGALDTPDPALYVDEDADPDSVEALFNPFEDYAKEQAQQATPSASVPQETSQPVEEKKNEAPAVPSVDVSVPAVPSKKPAAGVSVDVPENTKKPQEKKKENAPQNTTTSPSGPFRGLSSAASVKYMTLEGLRSADAGFVEAMAQAVVRAQELTQDPSIKTEMLQAFKMTDTYKAYVDMGSESVDAGVSLAHISEERQQMKKPYLSPEEFESVSQFMRVVSL